jgi:hypothetical protein
MAFFPANLKELMQNLWTPEKVCMKDRGSKSWHQEGDGHSIPIASG